MFAALTTLFVIGAALVYVAHRSSQRHNRGIGAFRRSASDATPLLFGSDSGDTRDENGGGGDGFDDGGSNSSGGDGGGSDGGGGGDGD